MPRADAHEPDARERQRPHRPVRRASGAPRLTGRATKSPERLPGSGRRARPGGDGEGQGAQDQHPSTEARMADPAPLYLSPERLKQLQRITDAIRLRAALYPSPEAAAAPSPHAAVPQRQAEPAVAAPALPRATPGMNRTTRCAPRPTTKHIARTEARHDELHPAHRCAHRRWRSLPTAARVRLTMCPGDAHRTAMRALTVTLRRVGAVDCAPLLGVRNRRRFS